MTTTMINDKKTKEKEPKQLRETDQDDDR